MLVALVDPQRTPLATPHHENIILYGSYPIEVERELAELGQRSYRSLREPARREREATALTAGSVRPAERCRFSLAAARSLWCPHLR
jgi:hypothetical protein